VPEFDSKPQSKLFALTSKVASVLRGDKGQSPPASAPTAHATPPQEASVSQAPPKQRTWDPEEWEEDERFIAALDLIQMNRRSDALKKLRDLHQDDPTHEGARFALFSVGIALKDAEVVEAQAEWVIAQHAHRGEHKELCAAYRDARQAIPHVQWPEKVLISALLAGDKAEEGRVVVDATKLLFHRFPNTAVMPRALLASANVQAREGRTDLACTTLKNIIARYPLDPLCELAQRRLAELQK
jgi:TolA-binding protein